MTREESSKAGQKSASLDVTRGWEKMKKMIRYKGDQACRVLVELT